MALITRAVAVLALLSTAFVLPVSAGLDEHNYAVGRHHGRAGPHRLPTGENELVARSSVGRPSKKKAMSWTASAKSMKHFAQSGQIGIVYNWQPNPPSGVYGIPGASQLWGMESLTQFRKVRGNYKYLMGPNEYNLHQPAGSGLSVGEVVTLWRNEIQPWSAKGHYLVAPSVTSAPNGITLMQQFFDELGGVGASKANAISLHMYTTDIGTMKTYVTQMHNALGNLDVWLSEFGCQDFAKGESCNEAQAIAFMQEVLQFCEETEWIVMCAPFGFMTGAEAQQWGLSSATALMDAQGNPTPLGEVFINF